MKTSELQSGNSGMQERKTTEQEGETMNIQSVERGLQYTQPSRTQGAQDTFRLPADTVEIRGGSEPSGYISKDTIRAFMGQLSLPMVSSAVAACVSSTDKAPATLVIDSSISSNCDMPFVAHHGDAPMSTTLAMNIHYEPVSNLRKPIEDVTGRKLDFLRMWDPQGEAHITTITPVEFDKYLKPYMSAEEMEAIAQKMDIQGSDVQVKGIGSGRTAIDGKEEETFFVIVDSNKLRDIRRAVFETYAERAKAQGNNAEWNYREFYPHITIGYTKRDLHIQDGVIKDVEHSLDKRFPHAVK
ncbi:MAG: 2'-5' RNA ligase family protein [Vulcanimicrobiota bacterium]